MACSKFERIEKLQKKLDRMTSDPAVTNELINREMGEIDKNTALNIAREEGEAKGRAEGEAKEKVEIAKKMLLANISVEQISVITGLSIEEIRLLQEERDTLKVSIESLKAERQKFF